MNIILKICTATFFLLNVGLVAQTSKARYTYDATGNRIQRKLVCPTCRESGGVTDNDTTKKTEAVAVKYGVVVYPNPTFDKMDLKISNMQDGEHADMELIDESGRVLLSQKNISGQQQVDMNNYRQGVYYLKVTVGKDNMLYKVIKVQ